MASRNPRAKEQGGAPHAIGKVVIETKPVKSDAIGSVGYDVGRKVLAVRYNNGGTYHYEGVPKELVDGLLDAKSMGAYVLKHIKGKFPAAKQ